MTADEHAAAVLRELLGPARRRALDEIDEREVLAFRRWADARPYQSAEALTPELQGFNQQREWVSGPYWRPERPPRHMPTLWAIVEHWDSRSVFDVYPDEPHCFGCQGVAQWDDDDGQSPRVRWNKASGYLDRAHLVDRFMGNGLDGPQNIVPLCRLCHRAMPIFEAGEGPAAIKWVQQGGWRALLAGASVPDDAGRSAAA